MTQDSERYRFGPFLLEVNGRELRRGEIVVPLTGKAFDLLLALVRDAGQVVTKSQLMAALWRDTVVEESNLTQTVFMLRKALGEDTEETGYIRTVPRRGYKFIGSVTGQPGAKTSAEASAPSTRLSRASRFWRALAVLAMVVAGALAFIRFRQIPLDLRPVRSSILLPEKTSFTDGPLALSPDGRQIVFAAKAENGKGQLWIRPLEGLTAQPLDGTEGAQKPFWSPDSRWVAFFADGKLKKIAMQGGPPIVLADAPIPLGGSWSPAGVILFSPNWNVLQMISSAGGQAIPAAAAAGVGGNQCCSWFLPDGEHYLFAAQMHTGAGSRVNLLVGSLHSSASKVIGEAAGAMYAQGRLLYLKENTLVAQSFDLKALRTSGEPELLAERVGHYRGTFQLGFFTVSATGLLAYLAEPRLYGRQLFWFDRTGKAVSPVGGPRAFYDIEISPDRKRLAAAVADAGNVDLWTYDLARAVPARFTFDPASEFRAVWSPDGHSIVFNSTRNGHGDLYRKSADGAGPEDLLYADPLEKYPVSWSRDGKSLLYLAGAGPQNTDLWLLPLAAQRAGAGLKSQLFLKASSFGQFSPDGKWVAYESDESQPPEIYVVPFSRPTEKHQISPNGGARPRWRHDGREIFYLTPGGQLMGAEVAITGDTVKVGAVRELLGGIELGAGYFYDVSADGQRIVAALPADRGASPRPIILVQNWSTALKR